LISYTIEASLTSKYISRTIVSTDSNEIKNIALQYGAEVPFLRPRHLSNDSAKSESALKHTISWLNENENYEPDIVVYLQITDPFRKKNMIDKCVEKLINNPNLDSVFMALTTHKNYWRKKNGKFIKLANDIESDAPRQIKEPIYREDTGIALASRVEVIKSGKRIGDNAEIIPYEQKADFIDIHSEFDLWLSEQLINEKNIIPNED
tara:strand:- start:12027 stop:12647 length:621 start_codon:yes stop_codon:yes gene_type:complete